MKINIEIQETGDTYEVEAVATETVAQLKRAVKQEAGAAFDPLQHDLYYQMKYAFEDDEPVDLNRLVQSKIIKLVPHVELEEACPKRHEWELDDMHLLVKEDDIMQDATTLEDYDVKPGETIRVAAKQSAESPPHKRKTHPSDDEATVRVFIPNYAQQLAIQVKSDETYGDVKRRLWEMVQNEEALDLQNAASRPVPARAILTDYTMSSDVEEGNYPSDREIDNMNVGQLRALCRSMKQDILNLQNIVSGSTGARGAQSTDTMDTSTENAIDRGVMGEKYTSTTGEVAAGGGQGARSPVSEPAAKRPALGTAV